MWGKWTDEFLAVSPVSAEESQCASWEFTTPLGGTIRVYPGLLTAEKRSCIVFYRDGNDSIGKHSDAAQGEEAILAVWLLLRRYGPFASNRYVPTKLRRFVGTYQLRSVVGTYRFEANGPYLRRN
jgi:hypothetical protein